MNKLDFESYTDFIDKDTTKVIKPLLFKASGILYIAGAALLYIGLTIPLLEMIGRERPYPDTLVEMLEWNPFSEIGLVGIVVGMFLFWLGMMVDRRGA